MITKSFNAIGQVAIGIALILGIGCTSGPPRAEASRALVERVTPTDGKEAIPSALYSAVVEAPAGEQLSYRDNTLVLLEKYTSALGRECRRVRVIPAQGLTVVRVACEQSSGDWRVEPDIKFGGDESLFSPVNLEEE